jgi:hypothetical protein
MVLLLIWGCGGTGEEVERVSRSRTEARVEAIVREFEGERAAAGYRAYTDCIRSKGVKIRYRPGVLHLLRPEVLRTRTPERRRFYLSLFPFDFEKPRDRQEAERFDRATKECTPVDPGR